MTTKEEKLTAELKYIKNYIIETAKYGVDNDTLQARSEIYKNELTNNE